MRQIFDTQEVGDPTAKEDWANTITVRLQNMLRAVSQPLRQPRPPQWAREPGLATAGGREAPGQSRDGSDEEGKATDEGGEGGESEPEAKEATEVADPGPPRPAKRMRKKTEWLYGWSVELRKAWRKSADIAFVETSVAIAEPDNPADDDMMLAVWKDRTTTPIAEVMVEQWREGREAKRSGK